VARPPRLATLVGLVALLAALGGCVSPGSHPAVVAPPATSRPGASTPIPTPPIVPGRSGSATGAGGAAITAGTATTATTAGPTRASTLAATPVPTVASVPMPVPTVASIPTRAPGTGSANGSPTASAPRDPAGQLRPVLSVSPVRARYDTPLAINVAGLAPGGTVTLRMTSVDDKKITWSSQAEFRADAHGRVSTRQAPVGGDYAGARPMGLVETLAPPDGSERSFAMPNQWTLRTTVIVDGTDRTALDVVRLLPVDIGVDWDELTVADMGVSGEVWYPPQHLGRPGPAVVVFGGSEGGLSTSDQAALLAAHGYPALALAYFNAPGLPRTLHNVPLEYFRRAARLLSHEPGVDPRQIVLWGTSRGGEAALLAGAAFPDTVAGVVAAVPSSVPLGAGGSDGPAWTLGGRPVTPAPDREFDHPSPTSPYAIRVERIAGPVLVVCGGDDLLGPSCAHGVAIRDRMARLRPNRRVTLLSYADAGHYVGTLDPWYPDTETSFTDHGDTIRTGGTFQADQAGQADAWPRILSWLAALPRS